jgi:chromosome segregation ATPase
MMTNNLIDSILAQINHCELHGNSGDFGRLRHLIREFSDRSNQDVAKIAELKERIAILEIMADNDAAAIRKLQQEAEEYEVLITDLDQEMDEKTQRIIDLELQVAELEDKVEW